MKYQILQATFIALFSSALTATAAVVLGLLFVVQPFQKAAVDRGFATWEVTDNATGTTRFVWNEKAQALLHDANPDIFEQVDNPLATK